MGFFSKLFATPDPQPSAGGIEFKQDAHDMLARMEAFVPYKGEFAVGMRVKIGFPMAGTAKPEETGLPVEIILDVGLTGTIVAPTTNEQAHVRWDPGTCRIYGDLDLTTMKHVSRGTLRHEGFECSLHHSNLQVSEQPAPAPPAPRATPPEPAGDDLEFYQYDMRAVEVLKGRAVCSDRECPCPETAIPAGSGYLFISPAAVARMTALREGRAGGTVGAGLLPVLVCEQGARRRGLDLRVAAEDARRWWSVGKVPLRPTPAAAAGA